MKYHSEVGVFLTDGKIQLVGDAVLSAKKGKVYADIHSDIDISDYYPKLSFMGDYIDTLLLTKFAPKEPAIKVIKDQVNT
ncbi:MAG TPA: hypothetical protein VFQ58_04905 [Flavisolibacter sp.]|nr:hypothetical protein [Flavisolibacter sp.]